MPCWCRYLTADNMSIISLAAWACICVSVGVSIGVYVTVSVSVNVSVRVSEVTNIYIYLCARMYNMYASAIMQL